MKVLSFGEILWDIFKEEKHIGGAPLNFAAFVSLLGGEGYIASAVGDDMLGKETLNEIESLGTKKDFISVLPQKPTGTCFVTFNEKGVPQYKISEDVAYDYIKVPENKIKFDALYFGSMALRSENNKKVITEILKDFSFEEIFVDINIRPPFYGEESIVFCLSKATILKVSEEELPVVTKTVFSKMLNIKDSAIEFAKAFKNLRLIIITKGDKGAFCYDTIHRKSYECEAQKIEVVSTVGAGDSFGASFLLHYHKTKDIQKSLTFATKISAEVCTSTEAIPQRIKD